MNREDAGGFCAAAVGQGIFTPGDTWEELCFMVVDATKLHYDGIVTPSHIRLHLLRDQILKVA